MVKTMQSKFAGRAAALMAAVAIAAWGLTLPTSAWAQSHWPEKPVRIMVPFAPGGQTDIVGRIPGRQVFAGLGQVGAG